MTDDEAIQWLSATERLLWTRCEGMTIEADVRGPLRSLAETRKALAECEWASTDEAGSPGCPLCSAMWGYGKHDARCIFATMPRPRET